MKYESFMHTITDGRH